MKCGTKKPAKKAVKMAKGGKVRRYQDGGSVTETDAEKRRRMTEAQNALQQNAESVTAGGVRSAISTVGNRRQQQQAQLEALDRELRGYARGGKVFKPCAKCPSAAKCKAAGRCLLKAKK